MLWTIMILLLFLKIKLLNINKWVARRNNSISYIIHGSNKHKHQHIIAKKKGLTWMRRREIAKHLLR